MVSNLFQKERGSARKIEACEYLEPSSLKSSYFLGHCWIDTFQARSIELHWNVVGPPTCQFMQKCDFETLQYNLTNQLLYYIFHVSDSALRDADDHRADIEGVGSIYQPLLLHGMGLCSTWRAWIDHALYLQDRGLSHVQNDTFQRREIS